MKKIMKSALLALSMVGVVNIANAAPVVWTLDVTQTTFSFAQVWGTFTYDADTKAYTDGAFHFSPNPVQVHGVNSFTDNSLSFGLLGGTGIFKLTFSDLLTDAGGIVTGVGSDNGGTWSFSVHSPVAATPVPEPDAYASILAGLTLLGFLARRKAA